MIYFEFRVHGIQSFIFATNRLKEMVGASALIDQLTEHDIQKAIKVLKLDIRDDDFARRAGGAFLVQIREPEQAYQLRDFWLMFVSLKIPGLGFSYALHPADRFDAGARAALAKELQINRCRAVPAPNAGSPFAERAPLTGLPAVALEDKRLVDETSLAKRHAGGRGGYLEAKLKISDNDLKFPLSFVPHEHDPADTLLAEHESDQYIAVIHADANELGKIVEKVYEAVDKGQDLFPWLPRKFSKAVEVATHKAVIDASTQIVDSLRPTLDDPHKMLVPMRFLVLGGDDVTLVTKASDALPWVKKFQSAFQEHAHEELEPFEEYGIPTQLTASAGVAFIKAKQPFHMAYHLAESLCSAAKAAGRKEKEIEATDFATPTVAFHRITTAMIDDWDMVLKREKTTLDERVLTMQPYANNQQCKTNLPALSDLETLTHLLEDVGLGTVRELLKAFHQGREHTLKSEQRLFENLTNFKPKVLKDLKQTLADLHVPQNGESLSLFDKGEHARTPLADAVAWDAIRVKENKNKQTQKEGSA